MNHQITSRVSLPNVANHHWAIPVLGPHTNRGLDRHMRAPVLDNSLYLSGITDKDQLRFTPPIRDSHRLDGFHKRFPLYVAGRTFSTWQSFKVSRQRIVMLFVVRRADNLGRATILCSRPIESFVTRVVLRHDELGRAFHPTDIALRHAFNRLIRIIRVRASWASSRIFLERDPGLVDELHPALLRKVDRWRRWGIVHDRVQCRRIYLHAELVARRKARAYFFAAGTILRLLLGAKCVLRPLPKMRADRGRVGSVEER